MCQVSRLAKGHIVRGEAEYLRIWNYIDTNPAKWREDCYYCQNEGV